MKSSLAERERERKQRVNTCADGEERGRQGKRRREGSERRGKMAEGAATASGHLHVLDHPILKHKLTLLRKGDTPAKVFREVMREITFYLG